MKSPLFRPPAPSSALALILGITCLAAASQPRIRAAESRLELLAESATSLLGGYQPQQLELQTNAPESLNYGDYARRGTLTLGERSIPALLADDRSVGDFRGQSGGEDSGVRLVLDLDGDGTFDRRPWESFALLDGDTGKVLATTQQLRGPALADTLKQALATRAGAGGK